MKNYLVYWLVMPFVIIFLSCDTGNSELNNAKPEVTTSAPEKIISLAPHLTELIYDLEQQDKLVATVEYSDYPIEANNIRRIGDAFRIDWELLEILQPDLVIAWQNGNPQHILDALNEKGFSVLALENAKLFTLPDQLNILAERVGGTVKAKSLGSNYLQGLKNLQDEYSSKKIVKVFFQISPEPLYTVDGEHVISEMLMVCGAINVFDDLGKIAAPVSEEAVLAKQADVILTTSEIHAAVVEKWSSTGTVSAENILSVSPDEVSRASLRMLQGTRNICETLDKWRQQR